MGPIQKSGRGIVVATSIVPLALVVVTIVLVLRLYALHFHEDSLATQIGASRTTLIWGSLLGAGVAATAGLVVDAHTFQPLRAAILSSVMLACQWHICLELVTVNDLAGTADPLAAKSPATPLEMVLLGMHQLAELLFDPMFVMGAAGAAIIVTLLIGQTRLLWGHLQSRETRQPN